ncbi:MAG: hypothetical protein JOZ82_03610, partial [Marmoricola sp.]|nr:hypothetical protein [Marmoricola sp.]
MTTTITTETPATQIHPEHHHRVHYETPVSGSRRRLTNHSRAAAMILLVSAQFVVMLDTSIVNVALPSIQ